MKVSLLTLLSIVLASLSPLAAASPALLAIPTSGPTFGDRPSYPTTGSPSLVARDPSSVDLRNDAISTAGLLPYSRLASNNATAWAAPQAPKNLPPQIDVPEAEGIATEAEGVADFDDALCSAGCCDTRCGCWFVSVGGLYVTRDRGNVFWLSFDNPTNSRTLLSTRDADHGWEGGWEVSFGRRIGCGLSWQATYWGTEQFYSSARVNGSVAAGVLDTPLNFGALQLNGTAVGTWFTTAASGAHRIERTSEFQNVELNLLYDLVPANCGNCFSATWISGVRFMRFKDGLIFGTSDTDNLFLYDNDEAYYQIDVENNMIGCQIGTRLDYYLCGGRVNFWMLPKVGLYGNHITHRSQLYTGDRSSVAFDTPSTKNDVSMLAQFDLGAGWQITPCIRAFGGYRVVALSSVALSDHQLNIYVDDEHGRTDINSNGNVLLHGGFAGLEFVW